MSSRRTNIHREMARKMAAEDAKHGRTIERVATESMDTLDAFEAAIQAAIASKEYTPMGLANFAAAKGKQTLMALATLERDQARVRARVQEHRTAMATLPTGDAAQQREIRAELHKLDPILRNLMVRRTEDPEVLRACETAPRDFPLVPGEILQEGRERFGMQQHPELVAEVQDLEGFASHCELYTTAAKQGMHAVVKELLPTAQGFEDALRAK
ncbi:MAG TPA: hypothetical protein VNJ04_13185 [Gemmatimonadaceae bacterium]|nr:hypothetical protein [Gemmatimonadaceae bacterium]